MNNQLNPKKQALLKTLMFLSAWLASNAVMTIRLYGQDGSAGIQKATDEVKGYFDTGCDLMYAIGAVIGIIGAIKVFNKWNAGEPDTNKVAASWFGSCIFLVIVATVLKSFFGV
ncbi:MAG: DUF4134 domain-containing protein [Sphingobacterium sp.]|jgi:hypothetical protein|nr:DUF4134 domain-containing protein [Sphingobacterium sp.]